jgi:oligopeptidase A
LIPQKKYHGSNKKKTSMLFAEPAIVQEMVHPCTHSLLYSEELIPFDRIHPSHLLPVAQTLLCDLREEVKDLETITQPTFETVILPLEGIKERFYRFYNVTCQLKAVMDSSEIREVWRETEPLLTTFDLDLRQNPIFYRFYKEIINSEEWDSFSSGQKRLVISLISEAEQRGIGLSEIKRKKFDQLFFELKKLQTEFNDNLLDATKKFSLIIDDRSQLEGVPSDVLSIYSALYNIFRSPKEPEATPEKGPWQLSLSYPLSRPIMDHCHSRELRKTLYLAHITNASLPPYDNSDNLLSQLKIRKKMAKLLGFSSFAEKSLQNKMARDIETVTTFLQTLRERAWKVGAEEYKRVEKFAQSRGHSSSLMPWDFSYCAERIKEEEFTLSEEEIKKYFPFSKVLEGLFSLSRDLFGVTIEKEPSAPVWHENVSYFIVKNEEGKQIASFYLDPFARPLTKQGGAWVDSCRNRFCQGGKEDLPIAFINCNASLPTETTPSLLHFNEVQTLFHEFGHALQHMLTKVDYPSVAGINGIEWDAVEIVSQFMENWCYHKETLKQITSHIETEEPLPDELIEKIQKAHLFLPVSYLLKQIKYATADLVLHHDFDPKSGISPFEVWQEVAKASSHIPTLPEDRLLCSFSHIFGADCYAAGYYSYLWAKVMSVDVFAAFEEADLNNKEAMRKVGEKFKQTFLELGGSLDPLEVFTLFRGREPSLTPFLKQYGLCR